MLEIQNLTVAAEEKKLLEDISLQVEKGVAIGVTGQSGSGKTTILRSLMGTLGGRCRITGGKILLDGTQIDTMAPRKRRRLNGTTLGFIPQNPMTAFDPRLKIRKQLMETFFVTGRLSSGEAREAIYQTFARLNLGDTERILEGYPSELSGGMLQRIVAAILMIMQPEYLIADEPMSALDEENSKILLDLLQEQKKSSGIVLVSHDIDVLVALCDYLYVMEQGRLIEEGPTLEVLRSPSQDWTKRLLKAYQRPEDGVWQWKAL